MLTGVLLPDMMTSSKLSQHILSPPSFKTGYAGISLSLLSNTLVTFFLSSVGSQDSLLEITYRSTVPAVICDPTTPKPELSAVNLSALVVADPTSNIFSSSNGTLGSPLGRDQCLLKLECFRFLQGPPPPRLPSPPPLLKASLPEVKGEDPSEDQLMSRGCLQSARFRESGIASEYESNTDTSDDNEDERDDEEEEEEGEMEIFGWGTDEETLRLLNALNKRGSSDCLGDEIVV